MGTCPRHGVEKVIHRSGKRYGRIRLRRICKLCAAERGRRSAFRKREWDSRNKEKRAAHKSVETAIARGILVREPCEMCGAGSAQAHHPDYTKHLDVMWLCPPCHKMEHSRLDGLRREAA